MSAPAAHVTTKSTGVAAGNEKTTTSGFAAVADDAIGVPVASTPTKQGDRDQANDEDHKTRTGTADHGGRSYQLSFTPNVVHHW